MPKPQSRQTFGLKSTMKAGPAKGDRSISAKSKEGVNIHPAVIGGGFAFIVAVGAVLIMGGQPGPQVKAGAVQITEVSGGSQAVSPPVRPSPAPAGNSVR